MTLLSTKFLCSNLGLCRYVIESLGQGFHAKSYKKIQQIISGFEVKRINKRERFEIFLFQI